MNDLVKNLRDAEAEFVALRRENRSDPSLVLLYTESLASIRYTLAAILFHA